MLWLFNDVLFCHISLLSLLLLLIICKRNPKELSVLEFEMDI